MEEELTLHGLEATRRRDQFTDRRLDGEGTINGEGIIIGRDYMEKELQGEETTEKGLTEKELHGQGTTRRRDYTKKGLKGEWTTRRRD